MNRHALEVLQFPETLQVVAGFASSALGGEAVRALAPADAPAWIVDELRRVDQMIGFVLRADEWAVPAIPDLRAPLHRLGVAGSVWDAPTLRDAAELLRSSRVARRAVQQHSSEYPLLAQVADQLVKREELEETLRRAVDDAGGIRDTASRELARLRKEIKGARGRIVERLEQFMASLPARFQVADSSVTVREGRYVVPIRREGRGEVGGLVHDESATGQTLYVEPPIAIELMNRLRELELAQARETQRILRELTDAVRPHQAALQAALEALIEIDSLYARARYALECSGRRPEMRAGAAPEYRVVSGRHPLLLAGPIPVVPFDLTLEPGERILLVSGPNTGGKTVLLKAIGLISAMAQSGIIPPVSDGTALPVFHDIFADIGDEQSIEASLSTFSAHLRNLREIVETAGPDSLVLIDEIGSGTDPAEGAALAKSILLELSRRGTMTVATSHLGELKLLASEEAGVVNASLQFDAVELLPTYRLRKGVPGRSYGIAIARRLGFPRDVLERAETFVPRAERDLGQLLEEIEAKERAAAVALGQADLARRDAEARRAEIEARETALRTREREAERRARQQARALLLAAREEVEAAIRELREAAEDRADHDAAIRAARQRIESPVQAMAEADVAENGGPSPEGVIVGARVRVAATGAEGTVVEVRDERALVQAGRVRLHVPVAGLILVDDGEPRPARPDTVPRSGGWTGPDFEPASEVDLRGLRADEVAARLQPALDAAIQAALPSLRIIHGKGTGALREVVAQLLRADRRVTTFRAGGVGEGGSGVTVAELT